MTIKNEGLRRLGLVADLLESLPYDRFDYTRWVGESWKGARDLSCGTTACALGWATTIPELSALGLYLVSEEDNPMYSGWATEIGTVRIRGQENNMRDSIDAAMRIFQLDEDEAAWLFTPGEVIDSYRGLESSPGPNATAAEVAAHIRRFIKENGE